MRDPLPVFEKARRWGGLRPPQTPPAYPGGFALGPPDLLGEGSEALELSIQALEPMFKLQNPVCTCTMAIVHVLWP